MPSERFMQHHYGASGFVNRSEPSPELPTYRKSPQDKLAPEATQLWMVVCNEGWRESIVCNDMYEWAADWLVEQIQGRPYAPGKH